MSNGHDNTGRQKVISAENQGDNIYLCFWQMATWSTLFAVVVWQKLLIVALHSHGFCSSAICQATLMLLLMLHVNGVVQNDVHKHFLWCSNSHYRTFHWQIPLPYKIVPSCRCLGLSSAGMWWLISVLALWCVLVCDDGVFRVFPYGKLWGTPTCRIHQPTTG